MGSVDTIDIDALEAGPETDRLVAWHVMKYPAIRDASGDVLDHDGNRRHLDRDPTDGGAAYSYPHSFCPSSDIAAAMEVSDKLVVGSHDEFETCQMTNHASAQFSGRASFFCNIEAVAYADEAADGVGMLALAISRVALKAVLT